MEKVAESGLLKESTSNEEMMLIKKKVGQETKRNVNERHKKSLD